MSKSMRIIGGLVLALALTVATLGAAQSESTAAGPQPDSQTIASSR